MAKKKKAEFGFAIKNVPADLLFLWSARMFQYQAKREFLKEVGISKWRDAYLEGYRVVKIEVREI